jgi:hypothetical protein
MNFIEYLENIGENEVRDLLLSTDELLVTPKIFESLSSKLLSDYLIDVPRLKTCIFRFENLNNSNIEKLVDFFNISDIHYNINFEVQNIIGDISALFLALAETHSLLKLDLHMPWGVNDLTALSNFMAKTSTLTMLAISNLNLNGETAKFIADGIIKNSTIAALGLYHYNIDDKANFYLISALKSNRYIKHVEIEGIDIKDIKNFLLRNEKLYIKIMKSAIKAITYFAGEEQNFNAQDLIILLEKDKNYVLNKLKNTHFNWEYILKKSGTDNNIIEFKENLPIDQVGNYFSRLYNYKGENFNILKIIAKNTESSIEDREAFPFIYKQCMEKGYIEGQQEFKLFKFLPLELQHYIFSFATLVINNDLDAKLIGNQAVLDIE